MKGSKTLHKIITTATYRILPTWILWSHQVRHRLVRVNTVRLDLHVKCLRHVFRHGAVRIQLIAQHVMRRDWNGAVLENRLRILLFVIGMKSMR